MKNSEKYMKKMLKVATYNIKHGGPLGKNCQDIARLINQENLDFIGIQEADFNISRSGKQNIIETIAKLAGYSYYTFHKALDYGDGEYGLGIISRYPYQVINSTPLVCSKEPRILVEVNIQLEEDNIAFFVTHLELGTYAQTRRHQFLQIKEALMSHKRFVLTGDFNVSDWNHQGAIFEYEEALGDYRFANHQQTCFYTYHSDYHVKDIAPIDNIITTRDIKMNHVYMIHNHYSDHNILIAEIQL
ncbi:MAG: endonuclease/exonuclease/phosphatase family protein [Bacilli bacterium]